MDNFYLVLNILLWSFSFFYFYKKKKGFDSGNILLLSFLVYAICSLILYNDSSFGNQYTKEPVTLFPLIYLDLMVMLTMSPVLRYNQNNIRGFSANGLKTIDVICYIFIAAACIKIPSDFSHIREGLTAIMASSSGGLDIYREVMEDSQTNLGDGAISNLPSILVNIFTEPTILFAWYNLVLKRRNKLTVLLLTLICIMPFSHLANSQRGPAISVVLTLVVTFFAFNKFFEKKFKRKLAIITSAVAVAMLVPFMAITHSRFDRNTGGAYSSVVCYIGQENLNFDHYAFDNNGYREGDRCIPIFKKMVGCENVPNNFWERRVKYPYLRINDEVFIGYVGDFVLDFGPTATVIIFIVFTVIFLGLTKQKKGTNMPINKLLILQFLMVLGIQGGMKLFPFADSSGLKIIGYLLIYWAIIFENNYLTEQKRALS